MMYHYAQMLMQGARRKSWQQTCHKACQLPRRSYSDMTYFNRTSPFSTLAVNQSCTYPTTIIDLVGLSQKIIASSLESRDHSGHCIVPGRSHPFSVNSNKQNLKYSPIISITSALHAIHQTPSLSIPRRPPPSESHPSRTIHKIP